MNFILSYSFFTSTDAGLSVSWDVSAAKDSLVNDQNTIILVRPVGINYWDIRTSGITRGMGQYLFPLPEKLAEIDVHVYLAFNDTLSGELSESRHVHVLNL